MDWFCPKTFESLRVAQRVTWGRPLRLFETTASTNDCALLEVPSTMLTGAVFVAREQTKGRGRRGHLWHAKPGENLTFSLLLRLPVPLERMDGLSLIVGLALRAALAPLTPSDQAPRVKWPNDVLINGKKIAGILIETRGTPTPTAIVGVGLNVDQTAFPETAGAPTSLATLGVPEAQRKKEALLIAFLKELEPRVKAWLRGGVGAVAPELNEHDALFGKRVRVDEEEGLGNGISAEGELILRQGDATTLVRSGHVTLIPD